MPGSVAHSRASIRAMRARASQALAIAVLVQLGALRTVPAAEPVLPRISPVRPVPAMFSVAAREISPLETGWSWTHRVAGVDARIRTSLEVGVATKFPGKAPVRFWHKRVEFLQPGQGPRTGAVIAVAHDKAGAVFAIGELAEGNPARKTEMYDPPRLLMPATVRADSIWKSAGLTRRVVGLADVDLGRWKFPGCVVVESNKGEAKPDDRSYLASGVGEVVTERRKPDGGWQVSTVLEEWTRPQETQQESASTGSI